MVLESLIPNNLPKPMTRCLGWWRSLLGSLRFPRSTTVSMLTGVLLPTEACHDWVQRRGRKLCAWIFVRRFVALFLHSCSSSPRFVLFSNSEGLAPWQIIVCSMHLLRLTKTLGVIMLLKMTGSWKPQSFLARCWIWFPDAAWRQMTTACHSHGCGTRDVTILAPSHIATFMPGPSDHPWIWCQDLGVLRQWGL